MSSEIDIAWNMWLDLFPLIFVVVSMNIKCEKREFIVNSTLLTRVKYILC